MEWAITLQASCFIFSRWGNEMVRLTAYQLTMWNYGGKSGDAFIKKKKKWLKTASGELIQIPYMWQ